MGSACKGSEDQKQEEGFTEIDCTRQKRQITIADNNNKQRNYAKIT